MGLSEQLDDFARMRILQVLARNEGSVRATARDLDLDRMALVRRMERLGIKPGDWRRVRWDQTVVDEDAL